MAKGNASSNAKPKKSKLSSGNFLELDLNRHCGVIISPSGNPCMRSLACKSHSLTSKRAVPDRSKDFDSLLLEYLAQHSKRDASSQVATVAEEIKIVKKNLPSSVSEVISKQRGPLQVEFALDSISSLTSVNTLRFSLASSLNVSLKLYMKTRKASASNE